TYGAEPQLRAGHLLVATRRPAFAPRFERPDLRPALQRGPGAWNQEALQDEQGAARGGHRPQVGPSMRTADWVEAAEKEAVAVGGAALIDVAVNPDEPPMPPLVT